jgi:23S rRNA pseudouridine1911/1915/1917 synthase
MSRLVGHPLPRLLLLRLPRRRRYLRQRQLLPPLLRHQLPRLRRLPLPPPPPLLPQQPPEAMPSPSPDPVGQGNGQGDRAGQPDLLTSAGTVDRDALFALYESRREGDDDAPVTVEFTLLKDLDKRLDRYLVDRIPFLSRTALQRLIREEAVTVNGRVPKPSTRLSAGDRIVATLPPPPSSEIPPDEIPLDVLFEDDTVGTEFARPGVVHRLDRHTTGVMVAAKSDTAHWRLSKQFANRTTGKRYITLVHGVMEPLADTIDLPLGAHPTMREKYAVRHDDLGKPSQTIYRTLETFGDMSLVEVELRTGRTHQIRVHLSHIGYPIVGDDIYGGRHATGADLGAPAGSPEAAERIIGRYALHAAMLSVRHPISGEPVTFTAPLWPDMRRALAILRAHRDVARPGIAGTTVPESVYC